MPTCLSSYQHSGCSKDDKMTQTEKSFISTDYIHFAAIQDVRQLEQENRRVREENRIVKQRIAEQGEAITALTSLVNSTRRQLKDSEERRTEERMLMSRSERLSMHEEELRRLSREAEKDRREQEIAIQLKKIASEMTELKLEQRGSSDMAYHRMTVEGDESSWSNKRMYTICNNGKAYHSHSLLN